LPPPGGNSSSAKGSAALPIAASLIGVALLVTLLLLIAFHRRRGSEKDDTEVEIDAEKAGLEVDSLEFAAEDGEYVNQLSAGMESFASDPNEGGEFDTEFHLPPPGHGLAPATVPIANQLSHDLAIGE
jgi:hypothetical protein